MSQIAVIWPSWLNPGAGLTFPTELVVQTQALEAVKTVTSDSVISYLLVWWGMRDPPD